MLYPPGCGGVFISATAPTIRSPCARCAASRPGCGVFCEAPRRDGGAAKDSPPSPLDRGQGSTIAPRSCPGDPPHDPGAGLTGWRILSELRCGVWDPYLRQRARGPAMREAIDIAVVSNSEYPAPAARSLTEAVFPYAGGLPPPSPRLPQLLLKSRLQPLWARSQQLGSYPKGQLVQPGRFPRLPSYLASRYVSRC